MIKNKLSIIIPCYNEEQNIKLIENSIKKSLRKISYEIIFINDGSKDKTSYELRKLVKKSDEAIKVIEFSRNFGKDAAIYAGIENSNGDYLVIIDADMQQDPSLIVKMLEEIENNKEIDIVAYYQSKRIEGPFIKFLKKSFYSIISKITKTEFKSGVSDFRLFRRNVADAILNLKETSRFTRGIFNWVGFNTMYLPYVPNKRKYGKSKYPLKKCIKYAIDGITSSTVRPLEIIMPIGIVFIIISLILLPIILINSKESILIKILIPLIINIAGIIIVLLGIVGKYISNIYNDQKSRPIYISKETYSSNKIKEK